VIEVACLCDDLPAHSHVYQAQQDGQRITMVPEPFDVRVWVDWRAVARSALTTGKANYREVNSDD
jgi:hypothetical protein